MAEPAQNNGTIRKPRPRVRSTSQPANVTLFLTRNRHPSPPELPYFSTPSDVHEIGWPCNSTTMLKKMTHRLTHFNASQKRSNQLDQPQLPAALPYYTEHRASISTQRTSLSEWSKREDSMELTRSALQRRPKAVYSIQDFVIHRTLGTGSFGRVHLGGIAASYRVLDRPTTDILAYSTKPKKSAFLRGQGVEQREGCPSQASRPYE